METIKKSKIGNWVQKSISARMLMVAFLILVLLIPLSYIENLISERSNRQSQVVTEINNKWGKEVLLYGPILKIPYTYYTKKTITIKNKVSIEKTSHKNYYYFLPEQLTIDSNIQNEIKKRGIYHTSVYKGTNTIKGTFGPIKFDTTISEKDILWEEASIIFKTSNLKGISNEVSIKLNDTSYNFIPTFTAKTAAYNNIQLHTLETKRIQINANIQQTDTPYSMELNMSGSERFRIIPIGKQTQVSIKSNWNTTKFVGDFLPYNADKLTANGFHAKWKVLHINRPFPQTFQEVLPNLTKYAMGVDFKIAVDQYQQNERSAKYGFLVIALTFMVFFLIQTISNIKIHPFQYSMIGMALLLFYTLLISISEHSSFFIAYIISSISTVVLISLYSKSILKNIKFPVFIALSLTCLYGFIFIIIQLENYALLVGSIGLFTILGLVMYTSRKITWD